MKRAAKVQTIGGRDIATPNLTVDRRLRVLISNPLPAEEIEMWAAMSTEQRAVAMLRMKAIARWIADRPPHDAKIWAKRADIQLPRFYEMSKTWRGKRSLAVVGASATAPRRRAGAFDESLNDEIRIVIDEAPAKKKKNLRYLAIELGKAIEARTGAKAPSYITLRRRVQDELRVRSLKERPGSHVQFDCCAFSLSTNVQDQLTMFVVLDVTSQLVIGASIGDAANSRQGYAHAARNALKRLGSGALNDIAWSHRLERTELVAGFDESTMLAVPAELALAGVAPTMQVAIAAKRFGKYLRKTVGLRIGRILLLSSATIEASGDADPDSRLVSGDDRSRFEVEIEVHNSSRTKDLERAIDAPPPAGLIATLEHLASSLDE
jgi:hypothetical protein